MRWNLLRSTLLFFEHFSSVKQTCSELNELHFMGSSELCIHFFSQSFPALVCKTPTAFPFAMIYRVQSTSDYFDRIFIISLKSCCSVVFPSLMGFFVSA